MRHGRSKRGRRLAIVFALFQGSVRPSDVAPIADDHAGNERPGRIRCPACAWQPNESSRWFCYRCENPERFFGGCGTAWNTFATDGVCPGCGHLWRWTACLHCGQWSPHAEWLESDGE
jgi:hypothetical protein